MKFYEKLDILLGRRNLKRVEFADKIGITYRAFAYYMSDTRMPRRGVLERIARELKVTPEFLLDDTKELELSQEEKFIKSMSDSGKSTTEAEKFLSQSRGLFAGNSLSDADKQHLMKCLTEIYEDSRKGKK